MNYQTILVTGGAGFVGSNLSVLLKTAFPAARVMVCDSLKRRGSELTLGRLREQGVEFFHADIRCPEDLAQIPAFDLLVDCSAEPSVHAGGDNPLYLVNTNLLGTVNLLELARRHGAAFLFLSTSRVYPIATINGMNYHATETRFELDAQQHSVGASAAGITEDFPTKGARSLYGATKLAGELLLQEYVYSYGMRGIINRCGILTGPWQMGKTDQGVIALWVARHVFGGALRYMGYGGQGLQVRDILHVEDLFRLVLTQLERPELWDGSVYNIGGGRACSISLKELTGHCEKETGKRVAMGAVAETNPLDVRIYLTDSSHAEAVFGWRPQHSPASIVADLHRWMVDNKTLLEPIFK